MHAAHLALARLEPGTARVEPLLRGFRFSLDLCVRGSAVGFERVWGWCSEGFVPEVDQGVRRWPALALEYPPENESHDPGSGHVRLGCEFAL